MEHAQAIQAIYNRLLNKISLICKETEEELKELQK